MRRRMAEQVMWMKVTSLYNPYFKSTVILNYTSQYRMLLMKGQYDIYYLNVQI